jgi:hypothetical protein
MTLLNGSGDVTLTWEESSDQAMRDFVARKMAAGFTFFIVEGGRDVRVKDVAEVGDRKSVVLSDAEAQRLFDEDIVEVAEMESRGEFRTSGRARTPEEAVAHDTVVARQIVGG